MIPVCLTGIKGQQRLVHYGTHVKMHHRRHRPTRVRLSLLVMVALLWTQLAMASHPACSLSSMMISSVHASMAMPDQPSPEPCHPAPPAGPDYSPACDSHCGRSDLAPEASRILSVPALGPLLAPPPVLTLEHVAALPEWVSAAGPLRSWHRPTPHTASLLLI